MTGRASQLNNNEASAQLFYKREAAANAEQAHKVLMKLVGRGVGKNRPAADIVAVLDVSGSMNNGPAPTRMDVLRDAMRFVVKKLGNSARLSIVTFSNHARVLQELLEVTEASRPEMEKIVGGLSAGGYTNMEAGLREAVRILESRTDAGGREAAILFMSDGEQNRGDAFSVDYSKYFVQTFGFGQGTDYNPEFLKGIAERSSAGVFSPVTSGSISLTGAFGQCLAGLLTVAVQELQVTVTAKFDCTIQKVYAGSYHGSDPDSSKSASISFGTVFKDEFRHLLLDISLPDQPKGAKKDYLEIKYTIKDGTTVREKREIVSIARVENAAAKDQELEEVKVEQARVDMVEKVREAGVLANGDPKQVDKARKVLEEARVDLLKLQVYDPKERESVQLLLEEVQKLDDLMVEDDDIYAKVGNPLLQACLLCHDRQRFAAKGEGTVRLFATPYMGVVLKQVEEYVKDPSKPVPAVDEDIQKEVQQIEEEIKASPPPSSGSTLVPAQPPLAVLMAAMVDALVKAINSLKAQAMQAYDHLLRILGLRRPQPQRP